ncbi:sugar phosphate isomerase/epimerase family protein [Pararhizobium sp. O133]|uniref:sugar phosphate isomerase/epimerase family protein n=1 Tax=Pararhizobium sp. O133 TaxID=3449278 RepID=UPI003F682B94
MRIGVDGKKIPQATLRGPIASFDHAREMGLSGLFFRTVLEMSPNLDHGLLRAVREKADSLGMYLETGLAKVNPYALAETPEVRRAGDGDTLLGFRRMMEACANIGCTELWVALANYKKDFLGKFACDRFRTDVAWSEQLAASERLLKSLYPIARDLGLHLNIETHEEATSFEVVRLVESVGPDVIGIVFDTSNPLQRSEHPVYAARRVSPYVRQTHIKDALLGTGRVGVDYQKRVCGDGVVDFAAILSILAKANSGLNLSIENDQPYDDLPRNPVPIRIEIDDPDWRRSHPDLSDEEFAAFRGLVAEGDARIARGEVEPIARHAERRPGYTETVAFIRSCADHLRAICLRDNLPLEA